MSHSNDSILCCHAEIQRLKLRIKALEEDRKYLLDKLVEVTSRDAEPRANTFKLTISEETRV